MSLSLRNLFFYVTGAIFILFYAFINGYPIIYHDLSTYVANGFDFETPIDRPITYCLFVWLFSLNGITLWTVVIVQSFITSFLIFRLVRILFPTIQNWYILLLILVLSLFTGLSWTASQIMPDIFTSLEVIVIAILAIGNLNKKETYLMYFLFLLFTAMHLSHISFNVVMILGLVCIKYFRTRTAKNLTSINNSIFLVLIILTVIAFATMASASAKSKHVFFMGAMVEHGIVQEFLNDNCDSQKYELCKYKDELPKRAYQFVWDENSPVYKMGSWKGVEDEFNLIIFETLTNTKYIFLHFEASIKATFDQLITYKINDSNGVFLEGTMPYDRMERYLPADLNRYRGSKQMNNELGFTKWLNPIFTFVIILSLVILFILLFHRIVYKGELSIVLLILLLGILINAWVSGTFANAINRLGCKMIWLIPFAALLSMTKMYYLKLKNEIHK